MQQSNTYLSIGVAMSMCIASLVPGSAAAEHETSFSVARLFFELNDTDGDLGIHGKVDGGPWHWIRIRNPRDQVVLATSAHRNLKRQGMSEIAFESAEPRFDELAPAAFFARFPAGEYEVEGSALNGAELESEVMLSHVMPAPPVTMINGVPGGMQCDADEPGYDAPAVHEPVVITWDPVTHSHPTIGTPNLPVEIANYEVVAEIKIEVDGEEFDAKVDNVLPPGVASMSVPEEFIDLGDVVKYEVLARAVNNNQIAIESCFVVLDDD